MRFLALIGALAIIGAIGAAISSSAASTAWRKSRRTGVVAWALDSVRAASVARHASDAPPNSLDDAATAQAGARAYATIGCVNCHGGPGVGWAKFSEGCSRFPPISRKWRPRRTPSQLFWVVKNGIKMTGMPSFGAAGATDQQIWTIVAFIRKWPSLSDADYKAWTAAP